MEDDTTLKGKQDSARINLSEEYEVRYWTETLGVSPAELAELVRKHGNSAAAVRQALGK